MKKMSKRTLTPKLRFPDFRDKPGWKEAKLSQLGKLISGLTYSPQDVRDNGLLVLRSSNIQNGQIALDDCVYVTPTVKGVNLVKPNDILICVRNGSKPLIGKNAMIPDGIPKCTHGAFMTVLRAHAASFVFQLLQTSVFQKQVAADLGATINSINSSNLLKYRFFVPTEPLEQERIADCLTALDTQIAAEGRTLEALKAHKKGLMRQLFPQPGQSQPRLRFPEFRDKKEWEEKAISELGEVITGSTPSTARSEYYGGDRQFVSPADISELRFVRETKTTLTELGFQQTRPIKAKSVLFVCIGSTIGKVAQNRKDCATNQQINSIIAGPETSADFLYYLLSECSERIAEIAGNQAVPIINKSLFSGFKVLCPREDEQHRIADSLTALDTQIEAQTAKIDALKTHKRGLMQQLFPAPEEP